MDRIPRIDLHMHTNVSDGTDSPEELLARVRDAGIGFFSVTDHDALRGCAEIQALLKPGDPQFVTGAEFSCRDASGKYHILGYRYDPDAASIRRVIETGHGCRLKKLRLRLDFLRTALNMPFSEEDEHALFALPNPGKPHIANLMVRYGYAPDRNAAIRDCLDLLDIPDDYVRPEEAIEGILGAGGIPVLAHPCYGDGDQLILGDELEERVRRLAGYGLAGLEAFYSGFTEKLRGEVLALADRLGLYVTAGSDYHGSNKLIRPADTGLPPDAPVPEGLARFLADAFGTQEA
jgi:predicted metal-dependent phosphoesterase TrpH